MLDMRSEMVILCAGHTPCLGQCKPHYCTIDLQVHLLNMIQNPNMLQSMDYTHKASC